MFSSSFLGVFRVRIKCDEDSNDEHMPGRVKMPLIDSAREVSGSVRVKGKNSKNILWSDVVKAAVEMKEAVWNEVLRDRDERCIEVYKEEKRNKG